MEKLFIPYELAVIAKEKGFNEPSVGGYNTKTKESFMAIVGFGNNKTTNSDLEKLGSQNITAPLYQQIVDWFRSEYKFSIVHFAENIYTKSYAVYKLNEHGRKRVACCENIDKAIEEAFKLI